MRPCVLRAVLTALLAIPLQVLPQVPVDLFAAAATVRLAAGPQEQRHPVDPSALRTVVIDAENVAVLPVLNEAGLRELTVRSFVVRDAGGKFKLFYPVVSVVDEAGAVLQTLRPRFEFRFENAVLTNEFAIPEGAARLLVHTRKEFYESEFESSFGERSRLADAQAPSGAAGVAAAAGLAFPIVGLLAAGILLASTGAKGTFTFGERGLVHLHAQ